MFLLIKVFYLSKVAGLMNFNSDNEDIQLISVESWESIFNSIEAPLMILDKKHRIVRINETMKIKMQIKGKSIGKKCYMVVHGTNTPPESCPHSQTIKNNVECTEEVELPDLNSWLLVTTSPIYDIEGDLMGSAHIAQDITEQKETEQKLQHSMELKELLMKETHHRVKNNLVTISDLLYLQSEHIEDQNAKDALLDSQNRARVMAIIHQKLYSHGNLEEVNLNYYFKQILDEVLKAHSINNTVHYSLNIEDIALDVDTSLILGLILNELISNSVQHAFSGIEKKAHINVSLHENEGKFILKVSDNGKTISEDFDIKNSDSFGLTIVNLLTKQINGHISIEREKGTTFIIKFRQSINSKENTL